MERERVYFQKGDHARIDGKMQVHHRLAFNAQGFPRLQVFSTCKHFIRTVPALVYDESNVEDIDTDGEDHSYDELRYVCMRNPVPAPVVKAEAPRAFDPLSTDEPNDKYAWWRNH